MAESDQNLDSFVDIVTNTAGILVLLVVLSIMRSRDVGQRFNPKLVRLATLQELIVTKKQTLTSIAADTKLSRKEAVSSEEVLRSTVVALEEAPEVRLQLLSKNGRNNILARRKEQHAMQAKKLADLRDQRRILLDNIAAAEAQSQPVRSTIAPPDLAYLAKTTTADLEGELVNLKGRSATQESETSKLTGDLEGIRSTVGITQEELTIAEAQHVTLKPRVDRAAVAGVHLLECHMPAPGIADAGKVRSCVRFVQPAGSRGAPAERKPLPDGENALQILREDSPYREFLAKHDMRHKNEYRLHFLVASDAYEVFRVARQLAWEAGWHVSWEPRASSKAQ